MTHPTAPDTSAVDIGADLQLALSLAAIADVITLERFTTHDLQVHRKPDRTPVTDADLTAEDAIRAALAEQRPRDAVLGEEHGGSAANGRAWLLDPIDGTKNFLRGVPAWGTLIALIIDGHPVGGVVSRPALGRRWWAAEGAGAHTCDPNGTERAITVSAITELADAYVSTTHLGSWVEHRTREAYLALVDACWENRAFGDCWQHCLVAEGAIDLAAEPTVSAWDVAAVQVIVEQAGGRFTDLDGDPRHDRGTALSSNGLLHDAALALLG
ncbi:MAG: histidinol-phosphatase [Actinomycetota bacterium]|nr:histidinol-phosphatase [Actinomycetota bacterium]